MLEIQLNVMRGHWTTLFHCFNKSDKVSHVLI